MATLAIDLPDALADALAAYTARKPGATTQSAIQGAIALWLLQGGQDGADIKRIYIDAVFPP